MYLLRGPLYFVPLSENLYKRKSDNRPGAFTRFFEPVGAFTCYCFFMSADPKFTWIMFKESSKYLSPRESSKNQFSGSFLVEKWYVTAYPWTYIICLYPFWFRIRFELKIEITIYRKQELKRFCFKQILIPVFWHILGKPAACFWQTSKTASTEHGPFWPALKFRVLFQSTFWSWQYITYSEVVATLLFNLWTLVQIVNLC